MCVASIAIGYATHKHEWVKGVVALTLWDNPRGLPSDKTDKAGEHEN